MNLPSERTLPMAAARSISTNLSPRTRLDRGPSIIVDIGIGKHQQESRSRASFEPRKLLMIESQVVCCRSPIKRSDNKSVFPTVLSGKSFVVFTREMKSYDEEGNSSPYDDSSVISSISHESFPQDDSFNDGTHTTFTCSSSGERVANVTSFIPRQRPCFQPQEGHDHLIASPRRLRSTKRQSGQHIGRQLLSQGGCRYDSGNSKSTVATANRTVRHSPSRKVSVNANMQQLIAMRKDSLQMRNLRHCLPDLRRRTST